jgi:hypothetical protein
LTQFIIEGLKYTTTLTTQVQGFLDLLQDCHHKQKYCIS